MSAREGLGQHQRMPAALAPHYVDVDELRLPQLLALTLEYAAMVRFAESGVGPASASASTWRPYFSADETLVMAEILAARIPERGQFDALLDQALAGRAVRGEPVRREQLPTHTLYLMIKQMDRWADTLLTHGSPTGIDLGALIAGLRARMSGQMNAIAGFYDSRPVWDEWVELPVLVAQMAAALNIGGSDDLVRATLKSWFNQLAKGIEMSQRAAAARLGTTLSSGRHDPGIGLLLAFAQLYQRAQEKLNRFTERHLDFYYGQVLRMRARGPQGDATFLVFQPAQPGTTVTVPAATAFLAPFDKQQTELIYASEHAVSVSDARVSALYTLFCERNPLTSPENKLIENRHGMRRRYPTGCRLDRLPVLDAEAALDTTRLVARPLLGAPRAGSALLQGETARIGFALASQVLLMQEGERSVHVTLILGVDRGDDGTSTGASLGQRLRHLPALLKVSEAEVRYKILRRMFTISISGAEGWIEVPHYSADFEPAGQAGQFDALHLVFELGTEAGAVVPYRAALHGGGARESGCPLLRFELNGEGYLYPYGLLRGLPLVRATVEVNVTGHRSLVIHNNTGPLSASAPFLPFGPLPAPGSYLVLGSAEMACKRLTAAELVLEWGGLPSSAGGFRTWYAGYDDEREFEDVQCAISVLADGRWQPAAAHERPLHTLFSPALGSRRQPIAARETVALDPVLHLARQQPRAGQDASFDYSSAATSGFFKVSLAAPSFAFGHAAYPYALAQALTNNSRRFGSRHPRALPNPPYAPLLDELSVNYTARATILPAPGPSGEALVRLHPLGSELAQAGGGDGADLLLPQIDYSGNLFVGLTATDLKAPLTLFFHLVEDALPMAEEGGRALQWSYLSDNKWKPLPPHALRADSTRAFLRPGIVTLTLPHDINRHNTIMPPEMYWLRVSCENGLEKFCSLYSVHAHAAQVWRAPEVAPPGAPARLPAATIRRPRQVIAGLGAITQMVDSFGGRLAEQTLQFRRRVAERLKHKDRAITPDDYERLILERFPGIDRVKCFPNLSLRHRPDGGPCPGHVLIVGLPAFASHGHLALLPRLNGDLVAQVTAFIAARISPSVTLEVVNPVYQRIQVRCKVRLAPGLDQGWYVNMLDRLVSDFISPWSERGNTSHFGWCIRQHDIESLMLAQDGVLGISQFSMLSVSDQAGDRFTLTDTAVPGKTGQPVPDITPAYPWSIAVPIKRHVIMIAGSEQSRNASRTGIGKLEIGNTFIISSGAADDKT